MNKPDHARRKRLLTFAAKGLAVYAAWYVIYDLWLLPDGRLDAWLSRLMAQASGGVLAGLGFAAEAAGRTVKMPGVSGIRVIDGCNGLATLGLFAGFVVAFPGTWRRRALFLPLGALVIAIANVGRLVVMVLLQRYWPAAFQPMHSFGLTAFFYVLVFALWMLWMNYGSPAASSSPSAKPHSQPAGTPA
jgi:exosortase family protein XrtF